MYRDYTIETPPRHFREQSMGSTTIERTSWHFLTELRRLLRGRESESVSAARVGCELGLEYHQLRELTDLLLADGFISVRGEPDILNSLQISLSSKGVRALSGAIAAVPGGRRRTEGDDVLSLARARARGRSAWGVDSDLRM